MNTFLIIVFFLLPLLLAILPGLLREDVYGVPTNGTISIGCILIGCITLGLVFPLPGSSDPNANISRLLVITLLWMVAPPRRDLVDFLQCYVHPFSFPLIRRTPRDENTH